MIYKSLFCDLTERVHIHCTIESFAAEIEVNMINNIKRRLL